MIRIYVIIDADYNVYLFYKNDKSHYTKLHLNLLLARIKTN